MRSPSFKTGGADGLPLRRPAHRQADRRALKKKPPGRHPPPPGRLSDHLKRRTVRLDKVETVVLDEADRMLDMGFIHDVTRLLDQMKSRRNLGLFSATISREVMDIAWVLPAGRGGDHRPGRRGEQAGHPAVPPGRAHGSETGRGGADRRLGRL